MGSFKIGKVVLKSMFKKPATLMYPVVPREWQDRTRGHVENDSTKCILCGICSRRCPTGAITVNREARTWSIERMACVQCSSCVDNCPKKSLTMKPEYTSPNTEKVVDTVVVPEQPKPAAPAGAAAPAAAPAASGVSGVSNDVTKCVLCSLCARKCPMDAITVDRAARTWSIDRSACVQCGACVENCPKKSLSIAASAGPDTVTVPEQPKPAPAPKA